MAKFPPKDSKVWLVRGRRIMAPPVKQQIEKILRQDVPACAPVPEAMRMVQGKMMAGAFKASPTWLKNAIHDYVERHQKTRCGRR